MKKLEENDIPEDAIIIDKCRIGVTGIAKDLLVTCPSCGKSVLEPYLKLNFYPCCGVITETYKRNLVAVLEAQEVSDIFDDAVRLFIKSEFSASLRSAVISLEEYLKKRVGRQDLFGTRLVSYALDSEKGIEPRIRINNYATSIDKNEQEGISYLVKGLMMCVRNPSMHNASQFYVAHVLSNILQCNFIVDILNRGSILNARSGCISPLKHAEFLTNEVKDYGIPVVFLKNQRDDIDSCLECPNFSVDDNK